MREIFSQFLAYMIVYMEIARAEIISLPDEHGVDPMLDFYRSLEETGDHPSRVKYQFIRRAWELLAFVKREQLPTARNPVLSDEFVIVVDGISYRNRLKYVGYLHKEPIYELRISLAAFDWYFRATFFPKYNDEGKLFYCFVFPFEKDPTSSVDPTDHFKELTYRVFADLRQHPEKYEQYFNE